MYDFEILVDHKNLVTISCFRTFLVFIQSYTLIFCIYFKCFFFFTCIYIQYMYVGLSTIVYGKSIQKKSYAKMRGQNYVVQTRACSKSVLGV